MRKYYVILLTFFLAITLTGCVKPKNYASIPNFNKEYKSKKNIIIVTPKVKMYEISAAGEEEISDWSELASSNMKESLSNSFNNNILTHTILDVDSVEGDKKALLISSNNLMQRITPSINLHGLETSFLKFDEKVKNFDYSIGDSLSNISNDGDVYLFINALDKVQSSGKKALESTKLIIGALFGVAAGDIGGITYSTATLVDSKTGKILWYKYYFSKGEIDLRERKGTDKLVEALLNDLQNTI